MNPEVLERKIQANSLRLPETLLSRLSLADEEIEDFDKHGFVAEIVREELEELEKKHGKVIDWNIQPYYFEDEGLKEK